MKHYSTELKLEVIARSQRGEPLTRIAEEYGIYETTVWRWIRAKEKIMNTAINGRRKPDGTCYEDRTSYSLKDKAEILIKMRDEGKTAREMSEESGIPVGSIRNWERIKSKIIAVYYEQGAEAAASQVQAKILKYPYYSAPSIANMKEVNMDETKGKGKKSELEYLRAKVAFLESLLEILGFDKIKKKHDSKQSSEPWEKE